MVVLFQQYTENICFFSNVSAGGLRDWGILLVISLEFQGNKASTVFYDTANTNILCADVADGKIGEKAPSCLAAEMEQPHSVTGPFVSC